MQGFNSAGMECFEYKREEIETDYITMSFPKKLENNSISNFEVEYR